MMNSMEDKMRNLRQGHPNIKVIEPSSGEYSQARMNAMGRGSNRTPLGIAYPQNPQEVSALIHWVKSSETDFCIRGAGNDFYGRSLIDGGLVIDLGSLKSVSISDDKKTVTFGGGITGLELVQGVEAAGLMIPFGNAGFLGYVGWVTMGGYGPLTKSLGLGFEGIVGAELVNADGDIIEATDEMLEGLRGMGGNLGVVTSMTIKTYPARKFLSGQVALDGSEANIRAVTEASKSFKGSSGAVLQHFVMSDMSDNTKVNLSTNFSWDGEDLDKGKEFLNAFVKAISPVRANTVKEVSGAEFMKGPKYPHLPFGGVRSVVARDIDSELVDVLVDGLKTKSSWGNMTWTSQYNIDHSRVPKNTFGPGRHAFITFSDIAPDERNHAESKKWADNFDATLQKCKVWTGMAYPPLMVPGTRTAKEMMGNKYERAMELKRKYDPDNVFKNAVPNLSDN